MILRVPTIQNRRQFLDAAGQTRHLAFVGDYLPRAQHVVCVCRPRARYVPFENDIGGFIDGELSAFDEIGEISFEERQGRAVRGTLQANRGRHAGQCGMQALKQIEPLRIVGQSRGAGDCGGRTEARVAAAEEGADQGVQALKLAGQAELPSRFCGRRRAGAAAPLRRHAAQHLVEALLNLPLRQSARNAPGGRATGRMFSRNALAGDASRRPPMKGRSLSNGGWPRRGRKTAPGKAMARL
jgi:hypothetical protein